MVIKTQVWVDRAAIYLGFAVSCQGSGELSFMAMFSFLTMTRGWVRKRGLIYTIKSILVISYALYDRKSRKMYALWKILGLNPKF